MLLSFFLFAFYFVFVCDSSYVICLRPKTYYVQAFLASSTVSFLVQVNWKSMRILLSNLDLVKLSTEFIASYLFSGSDTQQAKVSVVLLARLFTYPVVVFLLF